MIKKNQIGIFFKVDGAYKRIKKSTELEIATESNTEEFEFIADVNPTEMVKNYKISLSQDLVMIKGEDDFEFFYEKFYNLPLVPEVKVDTMVVFMFDGTSSTGYKAWETTSTIIYDNMNGVDSKINFGINFGGTIDLGTATMVDGVPTFTKAV